MPVITLKPYGNNRYREKIMVSRIVAFRTHESNSHAGTEIDLDNGEQILVGDYPNAVESAIKQSIKEQENES